MAMVMAMAKFSSRSGWNHHWAMVTLDGSEAHGAGPGLEPLPHRLPVDRLRAALLIVRGGLKG